MANTKTIEDEAALGRYLEAHVTGFAGLRRTEKFSTGQSNPTYLIEAVSGRYVLRAKPPGQLLKSAHMVEREYRVMAALAQSDVPVPQMFYLSEGENPLGRTFFVMGHVDGAIYWDPALPNLTPAARGAVYESMNETLAALHSVDPVQISLTDYGKPGDYFARQVGRWSSQYRASLVDPNPDMDHLMDWLAENLPSDDGAAGLVHGDYRLDNMIFDREAHRVLAVLDWELSTLGHPLADLAYQCMQWRLPNEGKFCGLGGLNREALSIPTEEGYIAAYCGRRDLDGVKNWPFYLAFSFFRLAAILEGVVRRAIDGNASNPALAQEYRAAIPLLAKMGADLVD